MLIIIDLWLGSTPSPSFKFCIAVKFTSASARSNTANGRI